MATLSIYLSKNATVIVREGDTVAAEQTIAQSDSVQGVIYDLPELLSIKPKDAVLALAKKEGDLILKGDVLARKKGLLAGREVLAPFAGTVGKLDLEGRLTILPSQFENLNITTPVNGTVKKISEEEIIIEFDGVAVYAKQGTGKVRRGILTVNGKDDEDVALNSIRGEHAGKVLLGGHFSKPVLEKAFGIGVASVLATSVDAGEFAFFEEKKLYDASLLTLSKADYGALKKFEGKDVMVDGKHKRVVIQ